MWLPPFVVANIPPCTASGTFFILLTNRVHPSRTWSNINIVRENVGLFVARALGRQV